ncbi:efflux RND transporter permease subunit [Thalassomonas actiniarum]|uniref:Efflux RND transporter permease subunit n=1 Tax=Thalassomonas actiniarum TaxID=485447 RepID=A0AAE9YXU5_9GAMM|nr:efflux RND transporter permease subunit [Thalassomonas actiniarum]WDE01508.1 efflux RND transporter permease subunit [Thalassomonas actiniarum]
MNTLNRRPNKYAPLILSLAAVLTLLGLFTGFSLPNALLPRIDRPEIVLYTNWPGKGAQEIEQTLIAPLEREMSGLNNLITTTSGIEDGSAVTRLSFHANADMQQLYMETLSRVNQVPGWPPQVAKPFVVNNAAGAGATLATAMLYATTPKTEQQLIDAFKMYIEPSLAKINGVSAVDISNNPAEQRVDIEFNPQKLSQYSLTIDQVTNILSDMIDRSGDKLSLGTRDYGLLFKGQIPLAQLAQLPVFVHDQHIVRLGELASIEKRLVSEWNFASIFGHRAMYFMLTPTPDVNALDALAKIKQAVTKLNQGPLEKLAMSVSLSRDDSKDIKSALKRVYGSLLVGIILACMVLFYYLRNWRMVSLVFVSIPVCLSLVMLAMSLGGYSLNVISLAGVALSVGLLLDAAIIVVENILRLKRSGLPLNTAITRGSGEIKGAIISSTISSIIIFLPILMMRTSESQLFEDLAFTISSALMASVVVALILIPTLARYFLGQENRQHQPQAKADKARARENRWSKTLTITAQKRPLTWLALLLGLPFALVYTYLAMPELDVLPNPKQRSINAFITLNEPMNAKAVAKNIAQPVFDRIKAQEKSSSAPDYQVYGMFCSEQGCLLYFYPSEGWDYASFKTWLEQNITHDLPGTQVFSQQGRLLRFAMPDSRSTVLDIKGDTLANLQLAGRALQSRLKEKFPQANIREASPLYNRAARIEFTPKQDQLIYFGLSQSALNRQLVALTDGIYLGRFYAQGDTLPFYFKAKEAEHLDQLLKTEIFIAGHGYQPLHQLVSAKMVLAPQSLSRINRQSSISLNLQPPENMPVGPFIERVKLEVDAFLLSQNKQQLFVDYRGSADRLSAFLQEFGQMFLLSLVILTLLMYLTLKSWSLAFAVIASMPLAIAGGMFNLQLLNIFSVQNLDVITMIGFIILMGLVINNAILLAGQYDQALKHGLSQQEAILEAVKLRKRPIYMSTCTTIFGMLPLMLSPGEGAEIYRGLAAVIIGGMAVSALFTLSFVSALLSLPLFANSGKTHQGKNEIITAEVA